MKLTGAKDWRESRGFLASVLLHLTLALLWLWWHLGHPLPPSHPLKAMNVDLVAQPVIANGPAGGAAALRRAPERTAPRIIGVMPRPAPPPPDELEARIAGLAALTAPDSALPAPDNDGYGGGSGSGGGYALADYVRSQILRRWWPALESNAQRGIPVTLSLKMSRTGVLSDIRILDQARFDTDKLFHDMALSARNAALNASPLALPPGHYDAMTPITITLDPKAVLR